jgi:hypothetical protein
MSKMIARADVFLPQVRLNHRPLVFLSKLRVEQSHSFVAQFVIRGDLIGLRANETEYEECDEAGSIAATAAVDHDATGVGSRYGGHSGWLWCDRGALASDGECSCCRVSPGA